MSCFCLGLDQKWSFFRKASVDWKKGNNSSSWSRPSSNRIPSNLYFFLYNSAFLICLKTVIIVGEKNLCQKSPKNRWKQRIKGLDLISELNVKNWFVHFVFIVWKMIYRLSNLSANSAPNIAHTYYKKDDFILPTVKGYLALNSREGMQASQKIVRGAEIHFR